MTGTERAALRLALGVLRASVSAPGNPDSTAVLALSRAWSLPTEAASWPCWLAWDARCREPFPSYRILRARLALYLRAVLRAERGDFGTRCCGVCRGPLRRDVGCEAPLWGLGWCACHKVQHSDPAPNRASVAVPLWSQAPGRTR